MTRAPHFALLAFAALCLSFPLGVDAEPAANGAGCGWLDCDNDGDLDLLYLVRDGEARLFENQNGNFQEISGQVMPPNIFQWDKKLEVVSVLCADFDNDGWTDIFITTLGRNILLINNGNGTFRDQTTTARVGGNLKDYSAGSAALDYDNDGWLDIFVANHRGQPSYLYRNRGPIDNGELVFAEKSEEAGVRCVTGDGGTASFQPATCDYDNDGDTDLYVVNDFETVIVTDPEQGTFELAPGPNLLYRNNGDGTFTDVSVASGTNDGGCGMGATWGDFNEDGWMDLYVTNFWKDVMYENNGDGTFTDVTDVYGINTEVPAEDLLNGWGTNFFDFDNDGDLDLHIAHGFVSNEDTQPPDQPDQLFRNTGEAGGYMFEDISAIAGINQKGDGRGAAYGDYDKDGFLDIAVVNSDCIPPVSQFDQYTGVERLLYHNMKDGTFQDVGFAQGLRDDGDDDPKPHGYADYSGNHWLHIKPIGAFDADSYPQGAPRTPIGTRVTVTVGAKTYMRDLGSSSFGSQQSDYLHFGLGSASTVDEIRVRFPNGAEQVLTNMSVDKYLIIHEVDGVPVGTVDLSLEQTAAGAVEMNWTYNPDVRDLNSFRVYREHGQELNLLGENIPGFDGRASFTDLQPLPGLNVYVLQALLHDGSVEFLARREFTYTSHTLGYKLLAPRPNPFTDQARIPLAAGSPGVVHVDIVDVAGRLVRTLQHAAPAGESYVIWDGLDARGQAAPGGVYYGIPRENPAGATRLIKLP